MEYVQKLVAGGYYEVTRVGADITYIVRARCMMTFKKMIAAAAKHGGTLVSRVWNGVDEKVTLRCSAHHEWTTTARTVIYQDSWCPECARERQRLGIEEAVRIAVKNGGTCLSHEYTNEHTVLRFLCGEGHQFEETLNEVKQKGVWCRLCQPKSCRHRILGKLRFGDAMALAEKSGGRHLGTTDRLTHVTHWECHNGHQWKESARSLLIRGSFCPSCDGRSAAMLRKVQKTAKARGGRCLSVTYENNYTPLAFECINGHQWEAAWKNVGGNCTWCPECARLASRQKIA